MPYQIDTGNYLDLRQAARLEPQSSYTRLMNAIDFDCPECGAKAGERCNTRTGKLQPVSHARRKRLAFDEKMRREAEETTTLAETNPAPTK